MYDKNNWSQDVDPTLPSHHDVRKMSFCHTESADLLKNNDELMFCWLVAGTPPSTTSTYSLDRS